MVNLDSILKSKDITFPTKVHIVEVVVFPVVMHGCDIWTIMKAECLRIWCFWTVVLEKTLESPLDCKEIKPVNPKGDQPWIFIERADAEALILWPLDAKSWLVRKDPDAGKHWGQEEKCRGWDGWMASLIQWTQIWASSGRCWRTGKPGTLQSMESQSVGRNWATEH